MAVDPGAERRAHRRYTPAQSIPVLFAHPDAFLPTAGLLLDVSNGGARIMAPPTVRPQLNWQDPLTIVLSYSEEARKSGIEGLHLNARVVRLAIDASGYLLHASFNPTNDGEWARLVAWILELQIASLPR